MVLLILLILGSLFLTPATVLGQTINEFMAHPSTGNNEWVEFYNPNNIDLTAYWLDDDTSFTDDAGSSNKKVLSTLNTTNGSYPYLEFSSFLNNSGDYVVLFSNDGTIVDQYQYTSDPGIDVSIGRNPDGGTWTTLSSASKGSTNGGTSPSPSPSTSPSPSPTPNPSSTISSTPTPSSTSTSTSSFTISKIPSQIDSTETFNAFVNLSLSNKPNTTFYLKGAFKEQDKTNYFGLTKVNESWIRNNKSYSDHVKITTDSQGFWSGNLEIQPDILDSGYEGAGEYIFKVGRYTESGSLTWSNEVTIRINTQEIILEDSDNDILAISGTQNKKDPTKLSKKRNEENSLEKYIRIATPTAETTAPSNQQAVVKGERTNYLNWVGLFMTACGIGLFAYVYLRSKDLREAIFNLFRKRN